MNTKCQFISVENIWNGDIRITIPDIQRGLVWNAAQIEVFWDSLLRGIPIGWFSVAELACHQCSQTKRARSLVVRDPG